MRKCSKPDGNKNWVGKRIAELRKDRGMSQNDLAIKLQNYGVDIDKNAVQLLEHGHRYVRDMELYVIAKVFGVSMEDLFAGTQFELNNLSLPSDSLNFPFLVMPYTNIL